MIPFKCYLCVFQKLRHRTPWMIYCWPVFGVSFWMCSGAGPEVWCKATERRSQPLSDSQTWSVYKARMHPKARCPSLTTAATRPLSIWCYSQDRVVITQKSTLSLTLCASFGRRSRIIVGLHPSLIASPLHNETPGGGPPCVYPVCFFYITHVLQTLTLPLPSTSTYLAYVFLYLHTREPLLLLSPFLCRKPNVPQRQTFTFLAFHASTNHSA
jgi:hypothetical protein